MDQSLNQILVAMSTEFPGEIKTDGRNLVVAQLKTFLEFLVTINPEKYGSIVLPAAYGEHGVHVPTDDNFSSLLTPVFSLNAGVCRQLNSGLIVATQMAEDCGIPYREVAKSNYDNCTCLDEIRFLVDRYESRMRDAAAAAK